MEERLKNKRCHVQGKSDCQEKTVELQGLALRSLCMNIESWQSTRSCAGLLVHITLVWLISLTCTFIYFVGLALGVEGFLIDCGDIKCSRLLCSWTLFLFPWGNNEPNHIFNSFCEFATGYEFQDIWIYYMINKITSQVTSHFWYWICAVLLKWQPVHRNAISR